MKKIRPINVYELLGADRARPGASSGGEAEAGRIGCERLWGPQREGRLPGDFAGDRGRILTAPRKTEPYSVADRTDWLRGDPRTCAWRPIGSRLVTSPLRQEAKIVAAGWLVTVGLVILLAIVGQMVLR